MYLLSWVFLSSYLVLYSFISIRDGYHIDASLPLMELVFFHFHTIDALTQTLTNVTFLFVVGDGSEQRCIIAGSCMFCTNNIRTSMQPWLCLYGYWYAVIRGWTSPISLCPSCDETGVNPEYGVISFDNILLALLNIITTISGEGWSTTMFYLSDAVSGVNQIIFILLMLVRTYYPPRFYCYALTPSPIGLLVCYVVAW
jgi:hypothetical protein